MDYKSYEHHEYLNLKNIRKILKKAIKENFANLECFRKWPKDSWTYILMRRYRLENLLKSIRNCSHKELIRLYLLPDDKLMNEVTAMLIEHLGE